MSFKECLDKAYKDIFPVLTYLSDWELYCIDMRDGRMFEMIEKQQFLSYCKRNLKGRFVYFIGANSNEIKMTKNIIQ